MRSFHNAVKGIALGGTAMLALGALAAGPVRAADAGVPHYAVGDRITALEEELKKLKQSYVKRGRPNVELTVSGQINRGIMFFDDGYKTDKAFVDNDNSSTRLRVEARARINDFWTAGGQVEFEYRSNPMSAMDQGTNLVAGSNGLRGVNAFNERKLEFWLDRKFSDNASARLWMGHGDTASQDTAEIDLSGTTVIGKSGASNTGGGLFFRSDPGGGFATGTRVSHVFSNINGLGRADRVRLDLVLGPLMLSGSAVERNRHDIALRFDHTFNNVVRLAAGVGYANTPANFNDGLIKTNRYSGSASILHIPSGVSLTGAMGKDDRAGTFDPYFFYAKLAIKRSIFEIGKTGVHVDYFYGADRRVAGDKGHAYGVSFLQEIDAASMDLYAGWRKYKFDHPTIDFADVDVVLVGGRIRF